MVGSHVLKTWSSTQPSVTLSSAEAEYYGVVKAMGIAIGQQSLFKDLGVATECRVWTDSSAALGIANRSGLGKLRHLQTHTLWVQQYVRSGAVELRKVKGTVNPADLFTKHIESNGKVKELVELFGCRYVDGRPAAAPLLRSNKVANLIEQGSGVPKVGTDHRTVGRKATSVVDKPIVKLPDATARRGTCLECRINCVPLSAVSNNGVLFKECSRVSNCCVNCEVKFGLAAVGSKEEITEYEAIEHDPTVLPHMHPEDVLNRYFPRLLAGAPVWQELEPDDDAQGQWRPVLLGSRDFNTTAAGRT